MNKFIAYFDYLGFKQFIENNDLDYQKNIIGNNFRDIENAMGQGKTMPASHGGVVPDRTNSIINCINFSDTIVFWTNDDSEQSLNEILKVAHRFNWQAVDYFFPARGSLVYGEIISVDYKNTSDAGGTYNVNSVFGKGLVKAHEKAEKQNWAGTVLDETFTKEIMRRGYDIDKFLKPFAKKFKVPYKNGIELPEEFVMCLITGTLNDEGLKNVSNHIIENFGNHNKAVDNDDVQTKIKNTLSFLQSFYQPET